MAICKVILRSILYGLLAIYLFLKVILSFNVVQTQLVQPVSLLFSELLGTPVQVKEINFEPFNKITLTDVIVTDTTQQTILTANKIAVGLKYESIWKKKLIFGTIQLSGFQLSLSKEDKKSPLNIQYIIDRFKSDKPSKPINLAIHSILLRKGAIQYDVLSENETPGIINTDHLHINDFYTSISVKTLQRDSLNIRCNRFSFKEQSGITFDKMAFKLNAGKEKMYLSDFKLQMPDSEVKIDSFSVQYDSLQNIESRMEEIALNTEIKASVSLKDLVFLVPGFKSLENKVNIYSHISGTLKNPNLKRLEINSQGLDLSGHAELTGGKNLNDIYIYGDLSHCIVDPAALRPIMGSLSSPIILPEWTDRLGNISFRGNISGFLSEMVAYGDLQSSIGTIHTDLLISRSKHSNSYSGKIRSDLLQFQSLGISENNPLGAVSFNVDLKAITPHNGQSPHGTLNAEISKFELKNYTYQNILCKGDFKGKSFDGVVTVDDPNLKFIINGNIDMHTSPHRFFFDAWLDKFNLKATNLWNNGEENDSLAFVVHSHFIGNSIDNMNGIFRLDNIVYKNDKQKLAIDSIIVQSNKIKKQSDDISLLTVQSKYLNGRIEGDYSLKSIDKSIAGILRKFFPILDRQHNASQKENQFNFDIRFNNTSELTDMFALPVTVLEPITICGEWNDHEDHIRLEGDIPAIKVKNKILQQVSINTHTHEKALLTDIHLTTFNKKKRPINLNLKGKAADNILDLSLLWSNSAEQTFCGELKVETTLKESACREHKQHIASDIRIHPTQMILNDTIWNIDRAHISIDSGTVNIDRFHIHKKDQFVNIEGTLSDQLQDTLRLQLKDINLDYIFTMVNLSHLGFGGKATGHAYAAHAFNQPEMNTQIAIPNFAFNNVILGDLDLKGSWADSIKGILLQGDVNDLETTHVEGYIFPTGDSLDLKIDSHSLDINFIYPFASTILTDLSGRATGNARLFGRFKKITATGNLWVEDGHVGIAFTNTNYSFNDSIRLTPNSVLFDNITLYDDNWNKGVLNGRLNHQGFKDLNFNMSVNTNNLLVYNTKKNNDFIFYGKAHGTGMASVSGMPGEVNININMTTNQSELNISLDNALEANEYQFIQFVDKSRRKRPEIPFDENIKHDADDTQTEINLNMLLTATPEAKIRLLMNEETNDIIEGSGNGTIRLEYNTLNDAVKMFGKYTIEEGYYDYSFLGGVQDKRFKIKEGSAVSFNGSPLKADLDINAYYSLSAFLGDLDDSFIMENSRNTLVNCLLNINGNLFQPAISFNVELPNAGEDVQRRVQNIINSDDMMNRQILYLLVFNKFYTPDYATASQRSNELVSGASSTISGLLNTALSGVMPKNWNLGTVINTNDLEFNNLDMQIALSSQLLNNRLLFNGNFGYRDNSLYNSAFIGDFDLEYKLTRSGNLRLKAYNKANEKYYLKSGLNTQGLGLIYKKDFDKWIDLFTTKRKRKKIENKQTTPKKTNNASDK